jgi:hypothetical protein
MAGWSAEISLAGPGIVSIADPEPDSGSLAWQAPGPIPSPQKSRGGRINDLIAG